MSTELTLFLLRLISGSLLVSVLILLFLVMWREYRSAVVQVKLPDRLGGSGAQRYFTGKSGVVLL